MLGEEIGLVHAAGHGRASPPARAVTCTTVAGARAYVSLRRAHQRCTVVRVLVLVVAVGGVGSVRQPRSAIGIRRTRRIETLRRAAERLAWSRLEDLLRERYARPTGSYRGLVAVVKQGLALEAGAAEVAVVPVEAAAASSMAVAAHIGQRWALIVHISGADVCGRCERLSAVPLLLAAATMLLLLCGARRRGPRLALRIVPACRSMGRCRLCIRSAALICASCWTRRHCGCVAIG
jgi:hypothetical protein